MEKVNKIIENYINDFKDNLSVEHLTKVFGKSPTYILSLFPLIEFDENNQYYLIDGRLIFSLLKDNDWEEYYYSGEIIYLKKENGKAFVVEVLKKRTRINLNEISEKALSGFHIAINGIKTN